MPRRPAQSPLAGKKASVAVERMGLTIRVDDVDAAHAGIVAADMLTALRTLVRRFPELRERPDVVPGGTPIEVPVEADGDEARRIGFTPHAARRR